MKKFVVILVFIAIAIVSAISASIWTLEHVEVSAHENTVELTLFDNVWVHEVEAER